MPYYVYKLTPPRRLEPVGVFDQYRAARASARQLRAELGGQSSALVRMVFAADRAQAERLLVEVREPRPLGEEA